MDMSQKMSFIVIFKFDLTIYQISNNKTITMPIDYKKLYLKCFQEKKALKKENQELKEEIEDIKEEYFEKGWETGKCDTFGEIDDNVKPLKEKIEELNEVNEQLEAEAERTGELESIVWIDFYGEKEVIDDIKAYRFRDDIIAMKKENEELKKKQIPKEVMSAFNSLTSNWWSDEKNYYSENFPEHTEKYDDEPENIPTKHLLPCNYTDLRQLDDWFNKGIYHPYEEEEKKGKLPEKICCECNRKQECLSDMFVYDVDMITDVTTVRCGMCALSFYESKSY